MATFEAFGVTTLGVWTEGVDHARRLFGLIRYPPDVAPNRWTQQIMGSAEFAADMAGFEVADIVDVRTTSLHPTSFSPIH